MKNFRISWKKIAFKCAFDYNKLKGFEDLVVPERDWIRSWMEVHFGTYKLPGYFFRTFNRIHIKGMKLNEKIPDDEITEGHETAFNPMNFICEGGKAVGGEAIRGDLARGIAESIIASIKKKIPCAACIIGSAGKRDESSNSSDIDIAVKIPISKAGEFLSAVRKITGNENIKYAAYKGFKLLSVLWPYTIDGGVKNIQVDFFFCDDLAMAAFFHHSPMLYGKGASRFKGDARTMMLIALASQIPVKGKQNTFFDGSDYPKDVWKYTLSMDGLKLIHQSFEGKHGQQLKQKRHIKEDDRIISKNPTYIVKFLFGNDATVKTADSLESIWNFMSKSGKFKWAQLTGKIRDKFIENIRNSFTDEKEINSLVSYLTGVKESFQSKMKMLLNTPEEERKKEMLKYTKAIYEETDNLSEFTREFQMLLAENNIINDYKCRRTKIFEEDDSLIINEKNQKEEHIFVTIIFNKQKDHICFDEIQFYYTYKNGYKAASVSLTFPADEYVFDKRILRKCLKFLKFVFLKDCWKCISEIGNTELCENTVYKIKNEYNLSDSTGLPTYFLNYPIFDLAINHIFNEDGNGWLGDSDSILNPLYMKKLNEIKPVFMEKIIPIIEKYGLDAKREMIENDPDMILEGFQSKMKIYKSPDYNLNKVPHLYLEKTNNLENLKRQYENIFSYSPYIKSHIQINHNTSTGYYLETVIEIPIVAERCKITIGIDTADFTYANCIFELSFKKITDNIVIYFKNSFVSKSIFDKQTLDDLINFVEYILLPQEKFHSLQVLCNKLIVLYDQKTLEYEFKKNKSFIKHKAKNILSKYDYFRFSIEYILDEFYPKHPNYQNNSDESNNETFLTCKEFLKKTIGYDLSNNETTSSAVAESFQSKMNQVFKKDEPKNFNTFFNKVLHLYLEKTNDLGNLKRQYENIFSYSPYIKSHIQVKIIPARLIIEIPIVAERCELIIGIDTNKFKYEFSKFSMRKKDNPYIYIDFNTSFNEKSLFNKQMLDDLINLVEYILLPQEKFHSLQVLCNKLILLIDNSKTLEYKLKKDKSFMKNKSDYITSYLLTSLYDYFRFSFSYILNNFYPKLSISLDHSDNEVFLACKEFLKKTIGYDLSNNESAPQVDEGFQAKMKHIIKNDLEKPDAFTQMPLHVENASMPNDVSEQLKNIFDFVNLKNHLKIWYENFDNIMHDSYKPINVETVSPICDNKFVFRFCGEWESGHFSDIKIGFFGYSLFTFAYWISFCKDKDMKILIGFFKFFFKDENQFFYHDLGNLFESTTYRKSIKEIDVKTNKKQNGIDNQEQINDRLFDYLYPYIINEKGIERKFKNEEYMKIINKCYENVFNEYFKPLIDKYGIKPYKENKKFLDSVNLFNKL